MSVVFCCCRREPLGGKVLIVVSRGQLRRPLQPGWGSLQDLARLTASANMHGEERRQGLMWLEAKGMTEVTICETNQCGLEPQVLAYDCPSPRPNAPFGVKVPPLRLLRVPK